MRISLTSLCDYYANLLAFQYRHQPKAVATIRLFCRQALAELFPTALEQSFDVTTAVGLQLNVIGKYVGIPRNIGTPRSLPYFGFWDATNPTTAGQNENGMAMAEDPAVNAQSIFLQSTGVGTENTALDDEAYRQVILLKIILNQSVCTLAEIQHYLHTMLPGLVRVTDNEDMSLTYTLSMATPLPAEVLKQYLPRPAGVALQFVTGLVTAEPIAVEASLTQAAPGTITSAELSVTVENGTAPFSYLWRAISSSRIGTEYPVANTAVAATTTISQTLYSAGTATSTWVCTVGDATGRTFQSNPVTVTLTLQ